MQSLTRRKRYLVVTRWGYPFGGGEAFLRDTLHWASSAGLQCMWLSFENAANAPHPVFRVHTEETLGGAHVYRVDIPGGMEVEPLRYWLRLLGPDLVHHQGHGREVVLAAAQAERVPVLTGYHFWHGLVDLGDEHGSRDILAHASEHRLAADAATTAAASVVTYVASEFMLEVLRALGGTLPPICAPCPRLPHPAGARYLPETRRYVTQVNVHRGKGGAVFLALLRGLPVHVALCCVFTEAHSDTLDAEIRDAAARELARGRDVRLLEWTQNIESVYGETRILIVPSVVDETYCRVCAEALQRGIPVLTSGSGNLRHLHPQSSAPTLESVARLYDDPSALRIESDRSLRAAPSEADARDDFLALVRRTLSASARRNVMIFAPWADQGLGRQAKTYVRLLREVGASPFVFSYLPYFSKGAGDRHQADPEEWRDGCVTYSPHIREKVTDEEVSAFVIAHSIGTCIVPETCWGRVFEIARLLARLGVRCCAVPNIEIVVRKEVEDHRTFWRILCNNRLCADRFREFGFYNCCEVAYALPPLPPPPHAPRKADVASAPLRLLCLGGMNAIVRKQVDRVCEAVVLARLGTNRLTLTATLQSGAEEVLSPFSTCSNIEFVTQHLTHREIEQLYRTHDVTVLVSKHEGLGIGFYESLRAGRPVVTLDAPPFSEIVTHGVNGWLLPCHHRPMEDNHDGVIESAHFDPADLARLLCELAAPGHSGLLAVSRALRGDYVRRFAWNDFCARFASAIGL